MFLSFQTLFLPRYIYILIGSNVGHLHVIWSCPPVVTSGESAQWAVEVFLGVTSMLSG